MSKYEERLLEYWLTITREMIDYEAITHPKDLLGTTCICGQHHKSCHLNFIFGSGGYDCPDLKKFIADYDEERDKTQLNRICKDAQALIDTIKPNLPSYEPSINLSETSHQASTH